MTRSILCATTLLTALAAAAQGGAAWAQPVTGLYVAGGAGANFLQRERAESLKSGPVLTVLNQRLPFDAGFAGLASVGYGFGNGLRLEIEGNYRNNRLGVRTIAPDSVGGRDEKYGGMANVLFDLDIGSSYIYPYIGAGAGLARTSLSIASTIGGTTLRTTGDETSFAYQAIAGLSLPIPPVVGLSLTAEYRYFALAGTRDFTQTSSFNGQPFNTRTLRTSENYNHSLLLGLRYAFNTPVPAEAVVDQPPAIRDPANRTYLVFFDWDRADLTTRARAIINEAAQATTKVAVTRIEVAGHTDKSGTTQYNQGLSQRRAANVASELVRLGVPRSAITTQALGESRPLVQTADGVREPQNRRVEIVLR